MDTDPRENSDLLAARNNRERNGNLRSDVEKGPPDGGLRAYAVIVGSFLTNGLLFGVINSYSVIYTVLEKQLKDEGITNSESRAALVGALTMGTTFFLAPLSGVLAGLLGLRLTAVLGGTIASFGLLISSFLVHKVDALYFTYGIMYGMGASFAYIPSLAILGHYFKKHLGLVNGFVTVGNSVFTVIMPPLMGYMIANYSLEWLFRLLALFTAGIALCGLLFKPIPSMIIKKPTRSDNTIKSFLKEIINTHIWKNRKYKFWALSMPVASFGYFVPYVHIKKFIEGNFVDVNSNLPLQCIGITSGVGRLIFGYLGDKPGINKILLQQISFYVIGTLTIFLPFIRSFPLVIVVSLGMGIFDGAFIALIGPIAIQLCGGPYAAQAIGCMLGLAATPLSVGPPIAGYLYSIYQSYTLPFILAGISPLVGATLLFITRFCESGDRQETNSNGVNIHPNSTDVALVGALTMGTTFFLSPLSGVLAGLLGLRLTAVLGGTIASFGLLISSFLVHKVDALYFTYGIMYGIGASFAYIPSLAILGHYFKKHLGLVNGFVTVGSSVFTVIMPPLMGYMIDNYSLEWLFRLLALFTAGIALCGLLFKPIPLMIIKKPTRSDNTIKSFLKEIINTHIWKNRKYRFWALSMPVALFGYFVPYVHIKKFIESNFVDVNLNLPLQCIGITSGVGRLIFGYLGDKPGIDRILLQQISFYVIGTLTIFLPFIRSFPLLIVVSLGMGIFDGAFISLIGPIAIQLCGGPYAAQAIGCMLGLAATPLSVGPPIAGYLYSIYQSYTLPFILAGISPLVGATLMFTTRFCKSGDRQETNSNGVNIHPNSTDVETSQALLLKNGKANQQTAL